MSTHVDDITVERDNYLGQKRILVDAMTRAFRDGASAMEVARKVAPAFNRDQVKQYLACVKLHDTAVKALTDAGLDCVTGVSITGIDAPREALLTLGGYPDEDPEYAQLPGQIQEALRDFHITLDLSHSARGGVPESPGRLGDVVTEVLLSGDPVRLIRAKPRT